MDELLTSAYRDLVDSASPPADAVQLVATRRAQRRRRRRSALGIGVGVAVCTAVVAALALSDGGTTTDPTPAKPESPAAIPAAVTCPDNADPHGIDFDHVGYDSFTEMLRTEGASNGAYVVDRSSRTVYFLRADRSAHTALTWTGDARSRWFPGSMTLCQDRQEWSSQTLDVAGPPIAISFTLGHCWLEPVELDSGTWDVIKEDQFGSGGGVPGRFSGTGTAWRTGDVVSYLDHRGARLTLVPEHDPWAVERTACD